MYVKIMIMALFILCIASLLIHYYKMNRDYKKYQGQALITPFSQGSKAEGYFGLFADAAGIFLMVMFLGSILFNVYEDYLLFVLILGYLIIYYINQYLPHTHWVIVETGFASKRNHIFIPWQSISAYRWLKKQDQNMLIILFKGKGITGRRADFVIGEEEKEEIEKLLNKHIKMM